jgi:hypothetical protein
MHIPVGFQTSAAVIERGTFACARCKHWQRAEVRGHGSGFQTYLGADGTARDRARTRASRDVVRTLRFATCPRVAPYVAAAIAIAALTIAFAYVAPVALKLDWDDSERAFFRHSFPLIVGAILVTVLPWTVVARWRGNDRRVRWLDF